MIVNVLTARLNLMNHNNHLLNHFLKALHYRFEKAIHNAAASYPNYEAGHGTRTPLELVGHMNGVLEFAIATLSKQSRRNIPEQAWQEQTTLYYQKLNELNKLLQKNTFDIETLERILQGPLADAMTHIGQLAMIRRLAKSAIAGENYFAADMSL